MSTDSDAIVAAIKGMSDAFVGRINKTDSDFVEHARRVEGQMEQLVDLTKHMAVMNAKSDTIREELTDIKATLRLGQEKVDGSIGRLHKRIDEVGAASRDHSDLVKTNLELQIKGTKEHHDKLEADYRENLARLDGAKKLATVGWILFTFVVGTFGFIGKGWLENLDSQKDKQMQRIERLETQMRETLDLIEKKRQ